MTSSGESLAPSAEKILAFWFDPASEPFWFEKNGEFDAAVAAELGPWVDDAAAGRLDHWLSSARSALALVLLLDQAPRNLHRGTAAAFACDAKALATAEAAVAAGHDRQLEPKERLFLYLPFEHAEDPEAQNRSVALIAALGDAELTRYAVQHRDIIARFGRFPHRNPALGRQTTPDEALFLAQPGSSF